jgi:hypothetical protein
LATGFFATSQERRAELERQQSETIARVDHIAAVARHAGDRATDDLAAVARFLNVERQALSDAARAGGFLSPQEVTFSGGLQLPTED